MDREAQATREIQEAMDGLAKWLEENKERLGDMIDRGERDLRFAHAHLEEWRREYPNHWVAVFDERLIAAESSSERLLRVLRKQNVPPGEAYVNFLPEQRMDFVLRL